VAGHGPEPKDPATRQRRNAVSTGSVIEAEPARMPALGTYRPKRDPADLEEPQIRWHPETRRWWKTIWASPIAGRWIDAHAIGLRSLARLIDDFWRASTPDLAKQIHAEIRLAEREFGLSVMAARSLNWEIRRPLPREERAAPLAPGADPRKILTMDRRSVAGAGG
jgi:hypothetical protein